MRLIVVLVNSKEESESETSCSGCPEVTVFEGQLRSWRHLEGGIQALLTHIVSISNKY